MIRKSFILIVFGMLIIPVRVTGQDPQFSQFFSNPLYLAPSFAGLVEDTRVGMNYRKQWPEIPGAFDTYSFSFDHYFEAFNSGLGFFALKDEAGSGNLALTNLGLQYSFDFKISDYWHIRPGIHAFYSERSIDQEKLLWHDQISVIGNSPYSAEFIPLESRKSVDFSSSVMGYSDKFWVGFAVDHLMTPSQSLYNVETKRQEHGYVPIKYSFFGGTKIIRKGRLYRPYDASLQIAFMYKQQGEYNQFDLGTYLYKKPLVLGVWYRGIPLVKPKFNQDAIVLLAGYKIENISIGYSYDLTISRLTGSTGGAHELSFTYSFKLKVKRKPRIVPCPDF